MKIRSGFVSNSSSSSFIVRRGDFSTMKIVTSKSTDKKLEKFGFRKTVAHHPNNVPAFYDMKRWEIERNAVDGREENDVFGYNYGYEVTCNQDDVIQFLIKNKISFRATCHYGHESLIYDSDTDILSTGINFGEIMSMYGTDDCGLKNKKPITQISGKEWLKNNKY